MKLTTKSRYGTRMLMDIAMHSHGGPVRVKDIARRQGISPKYLEKLISDLKTGGFIKSKRGPTGGHKLTRDPADISVGEIVMALEGDDQSRLLDCGKDKDCCPRRNDCLCSSIWTRATDILYEHLRSVTLADLIADARQCPKLEGTQLP